MSNMTYLPQHNKKKTYIKLGIALIFFGILGLLIITSFYSDSSLTGLITEKVVSEVKPNSTIKFVADLTIPVLKIEGNFQKVELKGNSESFLYVESERFSLDSKSNYITMENYTGEISFDNEKISALKGKASKVLINGIPIEHKTKSTVKVSFGKEFFYSSFSAEKDVVIKELIYATSGTIKLNDDKNIFNVENEEITLRDFVGDIKVENQKFKLDGYIKNLNIMGKSAISVSS